ncbi:hypothetical protein C8J56DRAFT_890773 [Mycena floridula]|nr:hypothetical protein C8J56DRAFT_890773 [Mycena floridula]
MHVKPEPKLETISPSASQPTTPRKSRGIQDVYEEAMIQMMQMRDRALGSLVNDVNQVLSQSPSRAQVAVVDPRIRHLGWNELSSFGAILDATAASFPGAQPVEDDNDLANQNDPFLRSLPPTIWQGCTYVVYHGASASDAGVYQTWAEVSVLIGPGPPWSDRSIFKKFLSIVQAQESFSEATCCGLITALMASLPNDGYECWVVTHGFKPGLYTKHSVFVTTGLAFSGGTYRPFIGADTKT